MEEATDGKSTNRGIHIASSGTLHDSFAPGTLFSEGNDAFWTFSRVQIERGMIPNLNMEFIYEEFIEDKFS